MVLRVETGVWSSPGELRCDTYSNISSFFFLIILILHHNSIHFYKKIQQEIEAEGGLFRVSEITNCQMCQSQSRCRRVRWKCVTVHCCD